MLEIQDTEQVLSSALLRQVLVVVAWLGTQRCFAGILALVLLVLQQLASWRMLSVVSFEQVCLWLQRLE